MMTDEEIKDIIHHMTDSALKWNMLLAQSDRAKLMAEVERLRLENERLRSTIGDTELVVLGGGR